MMSTSYVAIACEALKSACNASPSKRSRFHLIPHFVITECHYPGDDTTLGEKSRRLHRSALRLMSMSKNGLSGDGNGLPCAHIPDLSGQERAEPETGADEAQAAAEAEATEPCGSGTPHTTRAGPRAGHPSPPLGRGRPSRRSHDPCAALARSATSFRFRRDPCRPAREQERN